MGIACNRVKILVEVSINELAHFILRHMGANTVFGEAQS